MNRILLGLLASSTLVPAAAFAQATPSDFTSATRYDTERRVTGTIAPDPDGSGPLHHLAVRNSYDTAGRLVKVEKGELSGWQSEAIAPSAWLGFTVHQSVETTYDAMDRKLVEQVREGTAGTIYQLTQYSYDATGRLECTAVRMNPAAFGSLPASACTLGTQGSQGADRIMRNIYDAAGQLLQVRKAVGTSLEQAYVTYSYTANGKQEYVVDANGNKARLTYDGHDRQVQWQFPSASAPGSYDGSTPANALATSGAVNTGDYEAYGYDANGNRTSFRKRDARVFTYGYDALNRVISKIVPDACVAGYACTSVNASATRDVYYSYDLRGLPTAARFDSASGSDAVLSGWDGYGRQASSTTSMAGVSRSLSYQYDADGNRVRVTHPDGHFANYYRDGLDRLYYTDLDGTIGLFYPPYDEAGRVSTLYRYIQAGAYWGFGTNYGYDGVSRLASYRHNFSSGGNVLTTLAYNPASQIVSRARDNDDYRFTGHVNVDRNYATNGLNQYTSAGGAAFAYDANGNLISDGSTNYAYDAENRLVASSAGVTLVYDPLGRLYQVYKGGVSDTRFVYDGDALTVEYDGAGNLLKRYVHGPADGVDDPLVEFNGTSTSPRYLFADHQGSIVAQADANGNRIAVNSYDEYGIPANGNTGRFQYTGQAWISELGMYYYKARIYSPTLGRFMQTDPIGYKDQMNLYAYASNDPIGRTDPSGLDDLNILPKDESYLTDRFDFPDSYTIGAHGNNWGPNNFNHDVFPRAGPTGVQGLHAIAVANGYKGERTFLAVCFAGSLVATKSSPYHNMSFAQQYANETHAPVIAATGLIGWSWSKDGKETIATAETGVFASFSPGGSSGTYLGNKIVYNRETGKATIYSDSGRTGTRIRSSVTVDVKKARMDVEE